MLISATADATHATVVRGLKSTGEIQKLGRRDPTAARHGSLRRVAPSLLILGLIYGVSANLITGDGDCLQLQTGFRSLIEWRSLEPRTNM